MSLRSEAIRRAISPLASVLAVLLLWAVTLARLRVTLLPAVTLLELSMQLPSPQRR